MCSGAWKRGPEIAVWVISLRWATYRPYHGLELPNYGMNYWVISVTYSEWKQIESPNSVHLSKSIFCKEQNSGYMFSISVTKGVWSSRKKIGILPQKLKQIDTKAYHQINKCTVSVLIISQKRRLNILFQCKTIRQIREQALIFLKANILHTDVNFRNPIDELNNFFNDSDICSAFCQIYWGIIQRKTLTYL